MPEYEWFAGHWHPHRGILPPVPCLYFTINNVYYAMVVEIAHGEIHWSAVREPGAPETALGGSEATIEQAKRQVEAATSHT